MTDSAMGYGKQGQDHSDFSEMVLCLKTAIAEDRRPAMSSDARVKLYVLKAEQLRQQVQRGELTDLEARLALQELYVRLRQEENVERALRAL